MILNLSNLRTGGGIQVAKGFLIEANRKKLNASIHVSSDELADFISSNTSLGFVRRPKGIFWRAIGNLYYAFNDSSWITLFGPDWSIWYSLKKHVVGYAKPHPVYGDIVYANSLNISERVLYNVKNAAVKFWFRLIPTRIFAETQDVADCVRVFVNVEVDVISNVINPLLDRESKVDLRTVSDGQLGNKPFFLYVGANYKHKNLELLIDSFLTVYGKTQEFDLILTVPKMPNKRIYPNIHFIGPVNHEYLSSLYNNCFCVIQPSILECFSATYIEALYFGKPIIACDLPFARSILGLNAVYFDPFDQESLLLRIREREIIKSKGRIDFNFNNEDRYFKIISI